MTTAIETQAPPGGEALRQALYEGRIFKLPASRTSLSLVAEAEALLIEALGDNPRDASGRLGDAELFERVGGVRKRLYLEAHFHDAVYAILAELDQPVSAVAFDPLRLRCVHSAGHQNPRAKAVYYPHRDTWYGHPSALITVWIPLDDLGEHETFELYPERFAQAVPNDSEIFDYDAWVAQGWGLKIGWQSRDAGIEARYPGVVGEVDGGPALGFACKRGEILLFSGAQFHRTIPQATGRTRFSLDCRFAHVQDCVRGRGAPNVDNRSRGSALRDYVGYHVTGVDRGR